ncbi:MAG: hypothetical protein WKF73_00055 [Nocardioidaceae bacterium]
MPDLEVAHALDELVERSLVGCELRDELVQLLRSYGRGDLVSFEDRTHLITKTRPQEPVEAKLIERFQPRSWKGVARCGIKRCQQRLQASCSPPVGASALAARST